jgi:hypothetical protein
VVSDLGSQHTDTRAFSITRQYQLRVIISLLCSLVHRRRTRTQSGSCQWNRRRIAAFWLLRTLKDSNLVGLHPVATRVCVNVFTQAEPARVLSGMCSPTSLYCHRVIPLRVADVCENQPYSSGRRMLSAIKPVEHTNSAYACHFTFAEPWSVLTGSMSIVRFGHFHGLFKRLSSRRRFADDYNLRLG